MALSKSSFDRIIRRTLGGGEVTSRSYALVDTARDSRLYPLLLRATGSTRCLLGSELPEKLVRVAPFVVQLGTSDDPVRRTWREHGEGRAWGTLVVSEASIGTLVEHLKTLFRVHLHDGSRALFRFYDPRVLRVFLPTCSPEQLREFFGPMRSVTCEQEDGTWTTYAVQDGALVTRTATADERP